MELLSSKGITNMTDKICENTNNSIKSKNKIAKVIYWIVVAILVYGFTIYAFNTRYEEWRTFNCFIPFSHWCLLFPKWPASNFSYCYIPTYRIAMFDALILIIASLIYRVIWRGLKKRYIGVAVSLCALTVCGVIYNVNPNDIMRNIMRNNYEAPSVSGVPLIYLYPDEEMEVNVQLELNGDFTHVYPEYKEDGWTMIAEPDGTLTDSNGRKYSSIFWEGYSYYDIDLSTGFCVKGEDSIEFLEDSLAELGLTDSEANEFIMFAFPKLEDNEYNLITFQLEGYDESAKLDITPEPDTVIRINMVYCPCDDYIEIESQDLSSVNPTTEREGFTVVEWGITEINNANMRSALNRNLEGVK